MNKTTVEVKRDVRAERRAAAAAFREGMTDQGTLIVRLLSSPGSGKTTLLEQTASLLKKRGMTVGILVGDVETQRDAERLAPYAPSVQITTGGACHLEIPLIERALPDLGERSFDYLFIEDVGNLICPASHDLGEHLRVVLLSTTEGDDKPGKYPKMFRSSDTLIINKIDLLPHLPFSVEQAIADARRVQSHLNVLQLSATTGDGIAAWCDFLESKRGEKVKDPRPQSTS